MRKLTFLFLLVPFIALWAYGCDSAENPIGPNEQSLATDRAAAPGALSASQQAPKMVPLKARMSYEDDPGDGVQCRTPWTPDPPFIFFPERVLGQGQWTHLGRTTSEIRISECAWTPGGIAASGTATHTGANGDAIEVEWVGLFDQAANTILFDPIVITGGTGRFEGASGQAVGGGSFDPAVFWVDGMISSVGSI